MPDTLILAGSFAGAVDDLPPESVCSWTNGGLDAARVHAAGDLAGAKVELVKPPSRALGQRAGEDPSS